jgi:hypothetical protein
VGPAATIQAWVGQGLLLSPDWALDVASDECGSVRIRGEVPVFTDVDAYYKSPTGPKIPGKLQATTYQLRFTPNAGLPPSLRHLPPSYFCVPVASIRKVERSQPRGRDPGTAFQIDVVCKDVRVLSLGFADEAMADKMATHIRMVAFPPKIEFLQAFSDPPKGGPAAVAAAAVQTGWDFYDHHAELARIGVLRVVNPRTGERLYRASTLNSAYAFSPTYPAVLVFPERASDAHMQVVASFRSKARVPALTWMHPGNKTTLWRCSQPRVGMGGNTCDQDEQMLRMIREANVYSRDFASPLLLADCRPRVNAMANKAGGGGYEVYAGTQLEFMGIQNIHVVRDSHKKLEALALHSSPADVNWAAAVHDAGWLYHVRTVLSAALFVAESMHRKGQCVLVHCSDGWDRTAQVCGLAQLLLDPFYRTAKGYCLLIAKEWCSFGHKFNDRAGHREEKDDGDISPVFVQYLDATWQILRLFPNAFEFDARMLLLIAHHTYSCRFGTFLGNNERERAEANLPVLTPSLWGYVLSRADLFRNPSYDPGAGDVLLPHPASVLRHVTVWTDWFLRWAPYPSSPACVRMEKYAPAVYNHAPVLAATLPKPQGQAAAVAAAAVAKSGAASPAAPPPAVAAGAAATAAAPAAAAAAEPPVAPSTPVAGAAAVVAGEKAASTPAAAAPASSASEGEGTAVAAAAVDGEAEVDAAEQEAEQEAYATFLPHDDDAEAAAAAASAGAADD